MHLDNSKLVLKSKEGEVVAHDEVFVIEDQGMPMYLGERFHSSNARGRLFIKVKIDMPRKVPNLTLEEVQVLQKVLGSGELPRHISDRFSAKKPNAQSKKTNIEGEKLRFSPSFNLMKSDMKRFGAVGGMESTQDEEEDYASHFRSFFFR